MKKTQRIVRAEDIDKHQLDQNIADWVHQWTQRALSTEPADHERVERGIRDILLAAGRPEDTPIIWVDSPAVMFAAIRFAGIASVDWYKQYYRRMGHDGSTKYYTKKSTPHNTILRSVERYLERMVRRSIDPYLAHYVQKHVGASLLASISTAINSSMGECILQIMSDRALCHNDCLIDFKALRERYRERYTWRYDALHQSIFHAIDRALGKEPDPTSAPIDTVSHDETKILFRDAAFIAVDAALRRANQYGVFDYRYILSFRHWGKIWPAGRWEPIRYHGMGPAYYTFFRDVLGLPFVARRGKLKGKDLLQAYEDATSAGWLWFGERFVVVCEPPVTLKTERKDDGSYRLHADDGPAIVWRDGTALWVMYGVCVQRDVVEAPETLTGTRALYEHNIEARRIMIDRMGIERAMRDLKTTVHHEDTDQYGFPRRLLVANIWGEQLRAVEVVNPTPEPIGYTPQEGENGMWIGNRWHKKYMLHVSPWCETTQEAIAWTFGLNAEDYHPEIET